jgi:hypothetical protein
VRSPRRATGFAGDDGPESIDTPAAGTLCKAGTLRDGVFPLPASMTRSVAGIDHEIERTPLNDRSIATNHSADSPASPLRE